MPPLMGGVGAAIMAAYAWSRGTRTSRLFALFALAGVVWAWSYALSVAGADLPTKLFWAQVQQVGMVAAPVAWVAFAFQYTGREKWLTPRAGVLGLLLPAITLAMVASNETFGLMWSGVALETRGPFLSLHLEPTIWYMVPLAYSYALYLVGSFIILLSSVRAPQLYRQQSRLLLLGMFLPWAGSVVDLMGLTQLPNWQVAPMAFAFSALVVAWGVLRYQLLDLVPVARDTLVDASGDGLIVLDARNRIVDINPAALRILQQPNDRAVGRPAAEVITFRPDLFGPAAEAARRSERAEVTLGPDGKRRVYDLYVSLLDDERGQVTGRMIALRDITEHKRIEGELRAQRQLFADLVAVARATSTGPTLQDTLQNALNVSATLTGAERGSLFLLNPAAEVTHSLLTYGGITPDERQVIVRRVMDRGLAGWVVRQEQAVLIRDTAHDERWLVSAADVHPVGSALGVPILSGGVLAGVLTLTHSQANQFTEEHLNLMQAAADQMALALRNAQIFEAQREMAQRQATLYGVLRAVGEQLAPEAVASAAVEAISQLVGSRAARPAVSIALPERDRQTWVNYAAQGSLAGSVGRRLRMSDGIIGRAFRSGQPQYVPEVANDADYVPGNETSHSELAVPMRRGERVLGVLNLESDRPNAFSPEEMMMAESLADAVALALDNATLYQTIADESGRLQALIKSSRDGLFMASNDGELLVANTAALQLLGLPGEPESWLGKPVAEVLPPLRRQAPAVARAMLAELRRLGRGDEPAAEGEVEFPPRTLHWLSLPVQAGEGPLLGRLVVLRDVTEERLVRKLREELTDTLVHDLRNPLTNIRMALELLEQVSANVATPQQLDVTRIARSSTQRMLGLVNAILDVSRLESGQMPVNREPLELHALAETVIDLQQPLAQEKSLGLRNSVPADLPLVSADGGLIRRVLENLVGNAVKFTPEHGCVELSASADDSAQQVVVSVHDNGPGLAPETRGSLFQKFMTGRHSERGSGLGLAFCKLAVEAHGGRIWVESEPGQGATFCFTLPVAGGDEDEWDVVE